MASRKRIQRLPAKGVAGFTLIEVLVAMAVVGMLALTITSGTTTALCSIRMARENLRATQIGLEKMESIRVFNWDQLNTAGIVPTTFLAPFSPDGTTNPAAGGLIYSGVVTIAPMPAAGRNYSNEMKMVTVELTWQTGGMVRKRQQTTFVSHYGIQHKLFY